MPVEFTPSNSAGTGFWRITLHAAQRNAALRKLSTCLALSSPVRRRRQQTDSGQINAVHREYREADIRWVVRIASGD